MERDRIEDDYQLLASKLQRTALAPNGELTAYFHVNATHSHEHTEVVNHERKALMDELERAFGSLKSISVDNNIHEGTLKVTVAPTASNEFLTHLVYEQMKHDRDVELDREDTAITPESAIIAGGVRANPLIDRSRTIIDLVAEKFANVDATDDPVVLRRLAAIELLKDASKDGGQER